MKNKFLSFKLICGGIIATTPIFAVCSCFNQNKQVSPEIDPIPLTPIQKTIFNVDNGILKGFKETATKDQIKEYCKDNVLRLPACKIIGASAFKDIGKNFNEPFIDTISISYDTETIDSYAFYGATANEVTFYKGTSTFNEPQLQIIGEAAFSMCKNFSEFKFPRNLRQIDNFAFFNDDNLSVFDFTSYISDDNKTFADIKHLKVGVGCFASNTVSRSYIKLNPSVPKTDINDMVAGVVWSKLVAGGVVYKNDNIRFEVTSYKQTIPYRPIPYEWLKINQHNNMLEGFITKFKPRIFDSSYHYFDTLFVIDTIKSFSNDFSHLKHDFINPELLACKYLWIDDQGVKQIPDSLCNSNENLTDVRLATTVEKIGDHTFFNCSNLQFVSFKIDTNLATIDDHAFADCPKLCYFGTKRNDDEKGLFALNDSIIHVGKFAFDGVKEITDIKLWKIDNDSIIGDTVFGNCTNIKFIDFSNLDYSYVSTATSKQVEGSFANLMKTKIFFASLGVENGTIILPRPHTTGIIVDQQYFVDDVDRDQYSQHKYTGYYWLMNQNTTHCFRSWTLKTAE